MQDGEYITQYCVGQNYIYYYLLTNSGTVYVYSLKDDNPIYSVQVGDVSGTFSLVDDATFTVKIGEQVLQL